MPVVLILLAATVIELTVLIAVGHAIGVLATIALLILASLVGAALLRREGARTLRAFVEALRTRRPPHQELIDGMLIAAAGLLIVLPGFVSDVLGLLLLLPPIRAVVRRRMLRTVSLHTASLHTASLHTASLHTASLHTASLHTPRRYAPGAVVEGEVVDESSAPRSSTGELR